MEIPIPVIETATSLFLRYGLKSVSMDDIAEGAGISKKTLYQAVPSKEALIDHIVDIHICSETGTIDCILDQSVDALEEMRGISAMVTETLRSMTPALLYDMRKYYRPIWEKIDTFHRGHIRTVIVNNLERGMAEGLYRSDIPADIIARLYVVQAMALIDDDVFPAPAFEPETLMRAFVHYHLHGILTPAGRQKLEITPL